MSYLTIFTFSRCSFSSPLDPREFKWSSISFPAGQEQCAYLVASLAHMMTAPVAVGLTCLRTFAVLVVVVVEERLAGSPDTAAEHSVGRMFAGSLRIAAVVAGGCCISMACCGR